MTGISRSVRTSGRFAACLAAAASMVFASAAVPAPAHATLAQGVMTGAGDPRDDWADEGPMTVGMHSNAVAFWQSILFADGYISSDYNCLFDANTAAATLKWQNAHNLTPTGIADSETLGAASKKFVTDGSGSYHYPGPVENIQMRRDGNGVYYAYDRLDGNKKKTASYLQANAAICNLLPAESPNTGSRSRGPAEPFANAAATSGPFAVHHE